MSDGAARFGAPWSQGVTLLTAGCALLLLALPVVFHFTLPVEPGSRVLIQSLPLALLIGVALFSIQGYEVSDKELWIIRPLWATRVELAELESAVAEPGVIGWRTLRVVGSGGLFGFIGWFYNTRFGRFRAWVTDPGRTVVLSVGKRTFVVSPDNPARFVQALPKVGGAGRGSPVRG